MTRILIISRRLIRLMAPTVSYGKNISYRLSVDQNDTTVLLFFPCPCEFLASFLCSIGAFLSRHIVVFLQRQAICLIRLLNDKQFYHDTIKVTCVFTFTLSFSLAATAAVELYFTRSPFTAFSSRQRDIASFPNLKACGSCNRLTRETLPQVSISPLFSHARELYLFILHK